MPSYNKCIFVGNLTRDPAMKVTQSQTEVADFGIAVNHKYGDKEEVMFLDCAAFGKTAQTISQYFTKGKPILVEGRLKLDSWDDKNTGAKRSKHTLVVDRFTFIGSKNGEEGGDERQTQPARPYPRDRQTVRQGAADQPFPDEQQFKDDDIPF